MKRNRPGLKFIDSKLGIKIYHTYKKRFSLVCYWNIAGKEKQRTLVYNASGETVKERYNWLVNGSV